MMEYLQEKYDFSHKKRGIALLIHNEFFYRSSGYKDRPGDDKDYKHMKKIFKTLGFKICSYRDRTVSQIRRIAEKVAEMEEHSESDCFVCVVASHGEEKLMDTRVHSTVHDREHMIVGVDGKKLRTSVLIEQFDEDNCEALTGKPKFFFIQACRIPTYLDKEDGLDKGEKIPVHENIPSAQEKKKGKTKQTIDGGNEFSDTEEDDITVDSDDLTSDTDDDDEEFMPFKQKLDEEDNLSERSFIQQRVELRKKAEKKKKDELDSKGYTATGKKIEVAEDQRVDAKGHLAEDKGLSEDKVADGYEKKSVHKEKKRTQKVSLTRRPKAVPIVTMVPCPDDTLIMFASLSGNFAVRAPTKGGWLLNKLYDRLKMYTKDPEELECMDFSNILTEVLTLMSKEMYDPSESSSTYLLRGQFSPGGFTHCLTKSVYFTKKESRRKKKWLCL